MDESLWSGGFEHFIDRYKVDNAFVHYWQPIRGRELVGYLPWTLRAGAGRRRARRGVDASPVAGGARRRSGPAHGRAFLPYYMRQFRYDGATGLAECQWNGPTWPFQTTQALTGMANLLHDYHQDVATRADYLRLLHQYAALHFQRASWTWKKTTIPTPGDRSSACPAATITTTRAMRT